MKLQHLDVNLLLYWHIFQESEEQQLLLSHVQNRQLQELQSQQSNRNDSVQ